MEANLYILFFEIIYYDTSLIEDVPKLTMKVIPFLGGRGGGVALVSAFGIWLTGHYFYLVLVNMVRKVLLRS